MSLSEQFSPGWYRHDYRTSTDRKYTRLLYVGKDSEVREAWGGGEAMDVKGVSLSITHPQYTPNYEESGNMYLKTGPYDATGLFTYHPPEITGAYASDQHKAKVISGLGIAANEVKDPLVPDSALSQHSSRIAKKGLERGLVAPNERQNSKAEDTFDSDRMGNEPVFTLIEGSTAEWFSRVPDTEVRAGWQTVKSILGKKKPQPVKPAQGGEQLKLF